MNRSRAGQAQAVTIWALLAIALSLRIVAAVYWHQAAATSRQLFRLGDSHSYWILAGHIARGEPYQYGSPDASIFRAPLYPLVLAPFTLFADPQQGVFLARLLGCVCGTWAVWLVMRLARLVHLSCWPSHASECSAGAHDEVLAAPGLRVTELSAGLLAAIYPGAIGMSVVILSEAIFCPLMLLTLLGWLRSMTSDSPRGAVGSSLTAGVMSGLAILARPSWLLFMPFAGTLALVFSRRRAHQLCVLMVMAIGCAMIMSPWWLRNYRLTARFVPTTLQVGPSLYDGLHEGASGGSDENMDFVSHFLAEQRQSDQQAGMAAQPTQIQLSQDSSFEYRLNASMQRAAIGWVRENLSGAIRLALVKFARTWSIWPAAGDVGSSGLRMALTLGCFGILGLALWASLCAMRQSRLRGAAWRAAMLVCWGPALYFTWLHMIFVGSIRYREPAIIVLSALAGCGISWIVMFGQRQGSRSLENRGNS